MTNFNSNVELLYCMPAVGATKTTTTLQVVSGTTTGAPAYSMALQSLWPISSLAGKSLLFKASGTYDATAVTNTMQLTADITIASQTSDVPLAATGALTVTSLTTGAWMMEVSGSCVGGITSTASNWIFDGWIDYGVGNNAATGTDTVRCLMGAANTLGVPNNVVLNPAQVYFWELWSTWGTAPTAFVCSKYKIYAEN